MGTTCPTHVFLKEFKNKIHRTYSGKREVVSLVHQVTINVMSYTAKYSDLLTFWG
jgi:hypothetical protein